MELKMFFHVFDPDERQRVIDKRKEQLDAKPEFTDADRFERLFFDAGTQSQPVFFSLPDASPNIEQIKSDIVDFETIAQVGKSYGVWMRATDASLGKFLRLYGSLPGPAAEDMSILMREVWNNVVYGHRSRTVQQIKP